MPPALQVEAAARAAGAARSRASAARRPSKVDVRIIAATNRDLAGAGRSGAFREDLYYRLNVVSDRAAAAARAAAKTSRCWSSTSCERLGATSRRARRLARRDRGGAAGCYRWPGNVRELQNEIERIWVLSGDELVIGPEHLSKGIAASAPLLEFARGPASNEGDAAATGTGEQPAEESLNTSLERFERQLIERALRKVQGNRTRAAQLLGVSRRNLIRKLQQFGLAAGSEDADAAD